MRLPKLMFVYILTTKRRTVLYTGVTNDIRRRVWEHRHPTHPCFTSRYNVTVLVWYQAIRGPRAAIAREKQIKAGSRKAKIKLIESINPAWRDLATELMRGYHGPIRPTRARAWAGSPARRRP